MMAIVASQTGDDGCECDTDNSCSIVIFLLITTRPFWIYACLVAGGVKWGRSCRMRDLRLDRLSTLVPLSIRETSDIAEGALECLDVSLMLESGFFALRSMVRSSVPSELPMMVVTQPNWIPYGLIVSSKLILDTNVPGEVMGLPPLWVVGRMVCCLPGEQYRNRGRRAARDAATIPRPGSTIDQQAIAEAFSKNVGDASIPGINASRIKEAMLANEPRPSRHPAEIFVERGKAALQITVTGRREKSQSVKAFMPPAA
jgi:hypothetical protein